MDKRVQHKTLATRLALLTLLGWTFTNCLALAHQEGHPINLLVAGQYFREAKTASDNDEGRLWGVTLYGPMLFVEPDTRFVVANQADQSGSLRREGEVFVGKLPVEVGVANTATRWAGVTWTMVIWPLPDERQERVRLMTHELFHRVQDSIRLPASDPANRHLDSLEGRIWLRMEWRALERALYERGAARREAAADAIYFRRYRRSLFPQAASDERALETNEGLAEYTGIKLSSRSEAESLGRAAYALRQARFRQTFTRSFAYATGPAYGLLLDEADRGWRRKVRADNDLSTILQAAMGVRQPAVSAPEAAARAARYDGDEIIAAEREREERRREMTARYRSRLVEGPVLILPVAGNFNYTFNPNNVVPLDEVRTLYPTARVTDDWGILEVSDGVLMLRSGGSVKNLHVTAPADLSARPLQGTGWKLTLNEGWAVEAGERKGDFVVRKKN